MECEYCNLICKTKYILKSHLNNNKKCLKLRGLELDTKFICNGCNSTFINNINLNTHMDSCKKYIILKITEELQEKYDNDLKLIESKHKKIVDQLHNKYKELTFKYDELLERSNKDREWFEMKLNKYEAMVEGLIKDGMNKHTTTTTNTVNNTIRNQLSTLENLEPKKLEQTLREHYTERDFFNGQKGLANCCVEKIAKTPDGKMLICCSDMSRKKFKILDVNGNLKEDIEARLLCQKLKVPIQNITKEIYDNVIDRIDAERDRLSTDDRSRREKLLDDTTSLY